MSELDFLTDLAEKGNEQATVLLQSGYSGHINALNESAAKMSDQDREYLAMGVENLEMEIIIPLFRNLSPTVFSSLMEQEVYYYSVEENRENPTSFVDRYGIRNIAQAPDTSQYENVNPMPPNPPRFPSFMDLKEGIDVQMGVNFLLVEPLTEEEAGLFLEPKFFERLKVLKQNWIKYRADRKAFFDSIGQNGQMVGYTHTADLMESADEVFGLYRVIRTSYEKGWSRGMGFAQGSVVVVGAETHMVPRSVSDLNGAHVIRESQVVAVLKSKEQMDELKKVEENLLRISRDDADYMNFGEPRDMSMVGGGIMPVMSGPPSTRSEGMIGTLEFADDTENG